MEYIFHETQDGLLCAQHCLNSLLQNDYYSAVDLANIAHELDSIEKTYMAEGTSNESSNFDDTGFFSIQVIQHALKNWNLDLIPFKSSNELACLAREYPIEQKAYICNYKQHWYTIRKIGNYWFDLNSMFKKPQLISDTYLAVLLKQLEHDGYSIFIVDGELPKSQADRYLSDTNLDVKEILQRQNNEKKDIKDSSRSLSNHGFDDDELKRAIQMSLAENEIDVQGQNLYPSLAHNQNNEDEELKRAIELSLQANNSNNSNVKEDNTPKEISSDEIRKKRLEFLNKKI